MRLLLQTLPLLLLSFALSACGAAGKGGAKKSAFDELNGLGAELQAQLDETAKPVTQAAALLETFANLPKELSLSPEDYKQFVLNAVRGQLTVPGALDEKGKARLQAFADELKAYVLALSATPANAQALVAKIAEVLVKIPVLVTEVGAQAQLVIRNPLESADAKSKAQEQAETAKQLGESVKAQVEGILEQAKALPEQAKGAVDKFTENLKAAGIDSFDALLATPGKVADDTAKDVKEGVKEVTGTAVDSAK